MTKTVPQETSGVRQATADKPKSLTIDYQLYEQYLADSELSDEQKREFLNTLWQIVVGFVDLGFGVHPLQQACEQPIDLGSIDLNNVVTSNDLSLSLDFSNANQTEGIETSTRRKA